jgi:transcriptional regulator with XRE-family HTH domain
MYTQLSVGERLKIARKAAGLTQEELGEVINVKKSQISNIENGTSELTKSNAIVLCGELGVPLDWLLLGVGPAPEAKNKSQQHNQVVGNIGNLAGRDVRHQASASDCLQQLEAALLRITDLEARIQDKEELIALLRSK